MLTDLPKNKRIERAVNNSKEEPEFNKVSRISFKPSEYNHNYMRASTPNNTMFYGSTFSDDDEITEEQMKYERIIGSTEVSTLMRNSEILEGWSRITFGSWIVDDTISLATIIDPSKEHEHPYLNNLKDRYLKFLEQVPEDIKENTIKWLEFLSVEFSKKVANGNNHDYLISAKYTELFVNSGKYDGVIYPSVQSSGYGLCVAIHPNAVQKMRLNYVLQCKLTKTQREDGENNFLLENLKNCTVKNGQTDFELKEFIK
ncbi:hypothetical protein Musp01_27300 [Muricauda sp. NBRC 101325]|nr:hypothetical protein Musp01_27300 [Muricauda sp. NBRC 101325]